MGKLQTTKLTRRGRVEGEGEKGMEMATTLEQIFKPLTVSHRNECAHDDIITSPSSKSNHPVSPCTRYAGPPVRSSQV